MPFHGHTAGWLHGPAPVQRTFAAEAVRMAALQRSDASRRLFKRVVTGDVLRPAARSSALTPRDRAGRQRGDRLQNQILRLDYSSRSMAQATNLSREPP